MVVPCGEVESGEKGALSEKWGKGVGRLMTLAPFLERDTPPYQCWRGGVKKETEDTETKGT
jgi:hypothetical protein